MNADPEQSCGEDAGLIRPPAPQRLLPWLAALSAAGLTYRVVATEDGWAIRVPPDRAARARQELDEYERLNRHWPPPAPTPPPPLPSTAGALPGSIVVVGALLAFYRLAGPYDARSTYHAAGCAASAAIVAGAWWRAVTSLTLHADLSHLLGNALCCLLFGFEASRQIGTGLGWALILLTGIAGNLAAAYTAGPGSAAIGASTATFGALGLLSSFQLCRNYWRTGTIRGIWNRTWIPLGAGVALLALLGVRAGPGVHVDIGGHLFGFLAGLAAGLATAPLLKRRVPLCAQVLAGSAAVLLLHAAWRLALANGS